MLRKNISLILKLITAVCAFWGVWLSISPAGGFMSGSTALLYFTIQSNLWIGICCLVYGVFILMNKKVKPFMPLLKQVFTVSITLTGVVFCFVLAPVLGSEAWKLQNVLTHVIVPICAVLDFFVYDAKYDFKLRQCFWAVLPPLYYLCFATVGWFGNWNFGGGLNYPYFFLNWASPAGAFGFSDVAPNNIGTFYWIIILLVFVIGVSAIYIALAGIIKKLAKKS